MVYWLPCAMFYCATKQHSPLMSLVRRYCISHSLASTSQCATIIRRNSSGSSSSSSSSSSINSSSNSRNINSSSSSTTTTTNSSSNSSSGSGGGTAGSCVRKQPIRPFSAIPGPLSLPVVGTAWTYKTGVYCVSRYHQVLRALYEKYGPVVREKLSGNTIVHIFDPDDAKLVHQNEGKYPQVPPLQETALLYRQQKGMSLGLGNTNGEQWYRLRSAVQQMMMRPRHVTHYLPLANRVASSLVNRLSTLTSSATPSTTATTSADSWVTPQLERSIYKWALDSSCLVCTDREFGALGVSDGDNNNNSSSSSCGSSGGVSQETLADQMIDANRAIFRLSAQLKFAAIPLYRYWSTPAWRRLIKAEDFFYRVSMDLFSRALDTLERRHASGQLTDTEFSFLSYLLSRDTMSRNDVLIVAFSMFSDGLSTTVPALMAALWCLARSGDVQRQLYSEIYHVLGGDAAAGCDVTGDVINRLPLLRAVLKEALRLYPIGTEVSRITGQDLCLGGYHIPAGTHVDLNQSIHLVSERWFAEPMRFRPERWLTNERKHIHPYLHVPFGHGTRMCAGRRFAEQDIYTVLIHILRHFRLEPGDSASHLPQRYETLLVPAAALNIRLVKRSNAGH